MPLGCVCDPWITLWEYLAPLGLSWLVPYREIRSLCLFVLGEEHTNEFLDLHYRSGFKQIEVFRLCKQLQRRSLILEIIQIYLLN